MSRRPPMAIGLAFLAMLPALGSCSSSHLRDQYYGTDAGAGYQPEAATFVTPAELDASDAGEVAGAGPEAAPDDSTDGSDASMDL